MASLSAIWVVGTRCVAVASVAWRGVALAAPVGVGVRYVKRSRGSRERSWL